jgi:hypothetical protein
MPDSKELKRKLDAVRREARNLTIMAMRPDLSPEKAEPLRNAERSARASARVWAKALAWQLLQESKAQP